MKHRLLIILLAVMCAVAPANGQSIRTLGYNTTNGEVVYSGTNALTFTNGLGFTSGAAGATRTNLGLGTTNGVIIQSMTAQTYTVTAGGGIVLQAVLTNAANFRTNINLGWTGLTNTNASGFRSALELSAGWLTNTNVTNFRTGIGLGEQNAPRFAAILIGDTNISLESTIEDDGINFYFNRGTNLGEPVVTLGYLSNSILSFLPVQFQSNSHAATTRTNLGLPLPALTNTSNVTMMRALAGSTNTNQPFSGIVAIKDFNDDTHNVTVSNGIIVEWQAP
jgi:hypothetical protein